MSTLKVLWGSPLPPTRSGVSDYAAEILPELAEHAQIELLVPPGVSTDETVAPALARVPWDTPARPGVASVLHMGNNPYHLWIARRLRAQRGIVVLHDTILHHLLVEEAAEDGAWERFSAELESAHGEAGLALAEARRWGFTARLDPFLFPARTAYLRHADGVIVHSERALHDVEADCPGLPVTRVPLCVAALPTARRAAIRKRLRPEGCDLLMAHIGFLTPAKGLDPVLRSLVALEHMGVAARLVVVGEGSESRTVETQLRAAGLADRVTMWGWASPEDLGGILAAADLGVVLRYPTAGETSAAVLRFLGAGTPAVVSGFAQFLEVPEAAAPRVPPGPGAVAAFTRVAAAFARNPNLLKAARKEARNAWQAGGHAPDAAAEALAAAIVSLSA